MATKKQAQKTTSEIPLKLSETEQDLLGHLEHGYQLETDSLGGDPVLRKGDEVIRPASANRSTVEALAGRGLIAQTKSHDPLKIVWRTRSSRRTLPL